MVLKENLILSGIRFPIELHKKLVEQAKKDKRSLNAEVLVILELYLNGIEE